MNTPAHLVLNLCVLGARPGRRAVFPVLAGALVPDAPMFVFFFWEHWIAGASQAQLWGELYFAPGWQAFFDVFNSIPLALAGMAAAVAARRPGFGLFFASWLLHCLCDLPLHREDAHRHFLPFSDWRFSSPVSYWDPAYHGLRFAAFEIAMVLGGSGLLWRRHPGAAARAALLLGCALYLAAGALLLVTLSRSG